MTAKRHLRWKRRPAETGLAAVGAPPRGWGLHDGENEYAAVYPNGGGWQRKQKGWYWCASGNGIDHRNTCDRPVETPEQAKAEAMAYVKAQLAALNQEPTHDR